jgi:hypothetical protein
MGSTLGSSGILWIVGQVIADPFLGLLSLCGVVPRVPIIVNNPLSAWQVSSCWVIWIFLVRDEFVEYSISRTK